MIIGLTLISILGPAITKFIIQAILGKPDFGDFVSSLLEGRIEYNKEKATIEKQISLITQGVSNSLLDYLKNEDVIFDKDQLKRIIKVLSETLGNHGVDTSFLAARDFDISILNKYLLDNSKDKIRDFSEIEKDFYSRLVYETSKSINKNAGNLNNFIGATMIEILRRQTNSSVEMNNLQEMVRDTSLQFNDKLMIIINLLQERTPISIQNNHEPEVTKKIIPQSAPSLTLVNLPQLNFEEKQSLLTSRNENIPLFFRYLDCMDSVRYSEGSETPPDPFLRDLYMKTQVILTLLSGDLVVITENQFCDSQGFLKLFEEISRAAGDNPVPFIVAKQTPKTSLFDIVAKNIGKTSKVSRLDTYQLSGWPFLNNDHERRISWSLSIKKGKRPEKTKGDEDIWLDRLFLAFRKLENQTIDAQSVPGAYTMAQLYNLLINVSEKSLIAFRENIEGPVEMFKGDEVFDAAKEILYLIRLCSIAQPIKNRSLAKAWIKDQDIPDELCNGFLELADLLYNFVLGIASSARFVQMSTFRSPQDNYYIKAAYFLATYVQKEVSISVQKNTGTHDFKLTLESHDWVEDKNSFNQLNQLNIINEVLNHVPWENLINCKNKDPWKFSIMEYKLALVDLEESISLFEKNPNIPLLREAINSQQAFVKGRWENHIKQSNFINNDYWHIRKNKVILANPNGTPSRLPIQFRYEPFATPRWQSIGDFPDLGMGEKIKGHFEFRNKNWSQDLKKLLESN
jgi:hypothetical protein